MAAIQRFFQQQLEIEGAVWLTWWKDPGWAVSPPEHDYRDTMPLRPEDIAELYAPVIRVCGLFCLWPTCLEELLYLCRLVQHISLV